MNWITKAKSRVGRGKSKADIENQQRLGAINKLQPKNRHEINYTLRDGRNQLSSYVRQDSIKISGDMMMLGGVQPVQTVNSPYDEKNGRRSSHRNTYQESEVHERRNKDDPLSLLQFTVSKFNNFPVVSTSSFMLLCLNSYVCDL